MVLSFPNEYMHLIYKGVGVKLLASFKSGPLPHRLSSSQLKLIDSELLVMREHIPMEFSTSFERIQKAKRQKTIKMNKIRNSF